VPVFRSYSAYSFYHVTVPVTSSSFVFFFSSSGAHRDLHSFPTRRSSDLELAHQWWGQAVGWRNYHEQWISEGFAQYFAALYAQRDRKSTRLNSSHGSISYAVFCLKKKNHKSTGS